VAPTLYSHHDVWTANEIFARSDYAAGPGLGTAVDVGSNIGISALYFLTRNRDAEVFLYEPDPRNVERLRANLAPFAGRWHLDVRAVGPKAGVASFGREATGRYGGIGVETGESIDVEVAGINTVLETVLSRRPMIDVLKIDTEGLELETVAAIDPHLLDHIGVIYFESPQRVDLHADRFEVSYANETVRLARRLMPSIETASHSDRSAS
jgi:FkbM family methyltransferase